MKTAPTQPHGKRPWYREPWPWLLMAGPFIVVVAALYTAWIAMKTSDGLVTEDYYKKGLAINQTLLLNEKARASGLVAGVRIVDGRLVVHLQAEDRSFPLPPTIRVTLSHPTRAGLDQTWILTRNATTYSGMVRLPAAGHWLILLEDERNTWRLLGTVILPSNDETWIGATAPVSASAAVSSAAPADLRQ